MIRRKRDEWLFKAEIDPAARRDKLTLWELCLLNAGPRGHVLAIGTPQQVADALARIEPHSPIPDLLRRAVELGRMPFRRLIKESRESENADESDERASRKMLIEQLEELDPTSVKAAKNA